MNFQRQDLAGAIRNRSFLGDVPVDQLPPTLNDVLFRLVALVVLAVIGGILISASFGCTYNRNAPLERSVK